jgi:hypothetical protein
LAIIKRLKGLIKTYWDCQAWEWAEDHEDGLWTVNDGGMIQVYKEKNEIRKISVITKMICWLEPDFKRF